MRKHRRGQIQRRGLAPVNEPIALFMLRPADRQIANRVTAVIMIACSVTRIPGGGNSAMWEYQEVASPDEGFAKLFRSGASTLICGEPVIRLCPFCASTGMQTLNHHCHEWPNPPRGGVRSIEHLGGEREYFAAHICTVCGWWNVFRREEHWRRQLCDTFETCAFHSAAWGTLKTFDVTDLTASTEELIQYLVAKYDERLSLHPKKFEEIVGAVYAAEGYSVRVTSYSGDRGLDVIVLDGPEDKVVGIQVRRYRGKIKAEAIRSLAGAMLINGVTRGAFVTTSSFTKGAQATARDCRRIGWPVELIDADSFYTRLRLRQRARYQDPLDLSWPLNQFVLFPDSVPAIDAVGEAAELQS